MRNFWREHGEFFIGLFLIFGAAIVAVFLLMIAIAFAIKLINIWGLV